MSYANDALPHASAPQSSAAPDSRGSTRLNWTLIIPAVGLVFVFLILPLGLMFRISLNRFEPGEGMVTAFTAANYLSVVADAYYRETLMVTLGVATLTTVMCLLAGLPAAYYLARVQSQRIKGLLIILVILPLLTGNAVRTAGWMVVLSDSGMVNSFLTGFGLISSPIRIMHTGQAVVIGLTSVLLPFMIITLQSVIEGIDKSIEEASLSLGATPLRTFFKVVFPMALPGVFAGSLLCFILALNAYATPLLLGGPTFRMMAPALYQQITAINNWPTGATLAFVLVSVSLVLTVASTALLKWRQQT